MRQRYLLLTLLVTLLLCSTSVFGSGAIHASENVEKLQTSLPSLKLTEHPSQKLTKTTTTQPTANPKSRSKSPLVCDFSSSPSFSVKSSTPPTSLPKSCEPSLVPSSFISRKSFAPTKHSSKALPSSMPSTSSFESRNPLQKSIAPSVLPSHFEGKSNVPSVRIISATPSQHTSTPLMVLPHASPPKTAVPTSSNIPSKKPSITPTASPSKLLSVSPTVTHSSKKSTIIPMAHATDKPSSQPSGKPLSKTPIPTVDFTHSPTSGKRSFLPSGTSPSRVPSASPPSTKPNGDSHTLTSKPSRFTVSPSGPSHIPIQFVVKPTINPTVAPTYKPPSSHPFKRVTPERKSIPPTTPPTQSSNPTPHFDPTEEPSFSPTEEPSISSIEEPKSMLRS